MPLLDPSSPGHTATQSHWLVRAVFKFEPQGSQGLSSLTRLSLSTGMYDGTLGVIGAIEALSALKQSVSLPHAWISKFCWPLAVIQQPALMLLSGLPAEEIAGGHDVHQRGADPIRPQLHREVNQQPVS